MTSTSDGVPIIEEPVQFQYNSDFPSLGAKPPAKFPPADPNPCARITTRVYDAKTAKVETIPNVLVKTKMPPITKLSSNDSMEEDSSSSSEDDSEDDTSHDDNHVMMEDGSNTSASSPSQQERAYWMQRTVREAIYGRVLYAIVLKRRSRSALPLAEWEVTAQKCAVKEMSWQHIRKERNRLAEDPIQEVAAMQYLQKWYQETHNYTNNSEYFLEPILETNIMMPLDLLSDDRHLYSIMPYCDGGELFDRLDLNERFSEEEARYWMHQVLNGLENLQRAGICHRDMSLENLLVHQNGALIIDLGMCLRIPYAQSNNSLTDTFDSMNLETANGGTASSSLLVFNGRKQPRHLITPQGTCGKWIYMSPEIYKNEEPFDGFAVDIWASGVILFLMLTGFPPWERACMTDDRFKYMTAGYLVQMLTEWQVGLSSDAMDLLQRMLFLDPKDRLSLDQVKAHPWMVNGPRRAPLSGPF